MRITTSSAISELFPGSELSERAEDYVADRRKSSEPGYACELIVFWHEGVSVGAVVGTFEGDTSVFIGLESECRQFAG